MMSCLLIVATSAAMVVAGVKEMPSPARAGLTEQIGSAAAIPKSTRAAAARVHAGRHHNSPRKLKELAAANSRLIEKLSALPTENVAPRNVNAVSCATLICYHMARSWQQYQDAAKTIRSSHGNHQQITEQFRQEEIRLKANMPPVLTAPEIAKKLHKLQLDAASGHQRRAAAELRQQHRLMSTMVREIKQYQADYRRCLKEGTKRNGINGEDPQNGDLQLLEEKLSASEQALAAESEYITLEAAYYHQLYTHVKSGNN